MSELLGTLAGLIKSNGIPKKQLWLLLIFFLFIVVITWYLNIYENNTSDLITSTGIASFYVFSVLILLGALGFAQQQVDEGTNFKLAQLVRDKFKERGISFNKLWDTTIDKGNSFINKENIERTYWMWRRGSNDGILFTQSKDLYTAYAWIGESLYKLGDSKKQEDLLAKIENFNFEKPDEMLKDEKMSELAK